MVVRIFDKSRLPGRHTSVGADRAPHGSYYCVMAFAEAGMAERCASVVSCWNEAALCDITPVRRVQAGSPIALVENGDGAAINAQIGTIELKLPENEVVRRGNAWSLPKNNYMSGSLWKFGQPAGPAWFGPVTPLGASVEVVCHADI